MNLYQTQHPFYCGIDLHANQMYACVIDQAGEKLLHRNFKTRHADKFFEQIECFGQNIVVGCESTFNWYWLAGACAQRKVPLVLGHALYLKAIHGRHGKKIGNAHLKWACSEAVPLLKRCCPEVKTFTDRIEKKHSKARAFFYLAGKLGRAVYYTLKRGEAFEIDRMVG